MKKLAEETGGRMISVGNNYQKLKRAFDEIGEELRTQYEISYTPTNLAKDGAFRRISIKVKDSDDKVQARKGYYAPTE
jgi:VWFA-related protein